MKVIILTELFNRLMRATKFFVIKNVYQTDYSHFNPSITHDK